MKNGKLFFFESFFLLSSMLPRCFFISLQHHQIGICRRLMVIKELNIINFKNIADAKLEFSIGFNCLIGNNGVGKTNILDALYQLSMCKSYFNLPDVQNIRHGNEFFVLQGKYEREDEILEISCGVKRGCKKVFKKNQKVYEKLSEHIGLLPLVMISPEDIGLIEGGSEERRKLIDGIISQCDKAYLQALIRYNRTLLQRNTLLKTSAGSSLDPEILEIWDEQLSETGEMIMRKREEFLLEFRRVFQQYYDLISGGKEKVFLNYNKSVRNASFREALQDSLSKDRVLLYTTAGIHRDDVALNIDEYAVRKIGSQGQKKTFLIALKLAQYMWLLKTNRVKPLLLLDDIFDKLDAGRVEQIVNLVGEDVFGQIFITDTNREHIDEILKLQKKEYRLFRMEDGKVY